MIIFYANLFSSLDRSRSQLQRRYYDVEDHGLVGSMRYTILRVVYALQAITSTTYSINVKLRSNLGCKQLTLTWQHRISTDDLSHSILVSSHLSIYRWLTNAPSFFAPFSLLDLTDVSFLLIRFRSFCFTWGADANPRLFTVEGIAISRADDYI